MKLLPVLFIAGAAATAAAVISVLLNEEKTAPRPEDSEPDMPIRKEKLEPTECIYIDFKTFEDGINTELIKNEITHCFERAGITIVRDKCAVRFDKNAFTGGFVREGGLSIVMSQSDMADLGSQIKSLAASITSYIAYEYDHSLSKLDDSIQSAQWCRTAVSGAMSAYLYEYFRGAWENIPVGAVNTGYVLPENDIEDEEAKALCRLINIDNIKGLILYADYIKDGRLDTQEYAAAFPENAAVEWVCKKYPELL